MFENLTSRFSGIIKTLRGEARLTESNIQDALREVRLALLKRTLRYRSLRILLPASRRKPSGMKCLAYPGQALIGVVHQELINLMGWKRRILILPQYLPPSS